MSKAVVIAGWPDVPHISQADQRDLLKATPPYLRDARAKGIPRLGAGAIYPIEESEITCDPFVIPRHYSRAYAMDVGWKRTAAAWGAFDREDDTWYLYAEHYRGQAEPSVHASAIRARGEWIPGVIDPAARGRSQHDGKALMDQYEELGLELTQADNAVEAGIADCYERLSTGRIKIFKTLRNLLAEYRLYRRDESGKIVKTADHLMDCLRYLVRTGPAVMTTEPQRAYEGSRDDRRGRSATGGY